MRVLCVRLSIATKIFVSFSGLLAGVVVLSVLSFQEISHALKHLRAIRDGHLSLARIAAQLDTHQHNRLRDLRRALQEPDAKSRSVILRVATRYYPAVLDAAAVALDAACANIVQSHEAHRKFCRGVQDKMIPVSLASRSLEDFTERFGQQTMVPDQIYEQELNEISESLRLAIFEFDRYLRSETDNAITNAEQNEQYALWRVFYSMIGALVFGLSITYIASRTIAPIKPLALYSRAISRGDYSYPLNVPGKDELGMLATELKKMAKARQAREEELARQAKELEVAYIRVHDLQRYHESIVQSLRTGIVVSDRHGVVTSINRAANTHWGLGDLTNKPIQDHNLGEAISKHLGQLADLLSGPYPTKSASAINFDSKLIDITITPLQNDDESQFQGMVITLEDVTEAIRTKEALLRAERLAAIGRMSAHVTHELRNPLSSIGLNAELLEEFTDTAQAQELCKAIGREADRLTALTEEYLRFARMPRFEPEPTLAQTILGQLAEFVKRDCEAAQVRIEVDISDDIPVVMLDPDQIRQALLNLVRNAKESMPEGGSIRMSAYRNHDKREIAFSIADQGMGIATEDLERIFDPFYSTKMTGTGLGLALTQQIIQEHGGRIEAKSQPGQGTEFVVFLPYSS